MITRTDWPYPRVVAHRGGGTLAPENTLAALDEGARARVVPHLCIRHVRRECQQPQTAGGQGRGERTIHR